MKSSQEAAGEKLLLKALASRDASAYETLYKQHFKRLMLLSLKFTGDAVPSEEIVNDIFITLWERADFPQIEFSIYGYLHRSVRNASLNYLRKESRVAVLQTELSRAQDEADGREAMQLEEKLHRLELAVEQLPPKCREVLKMSRFERKKQQAIADELGISIKTVKNHLTFAFRKLKDILQEDKQFTSILWLWAGWKQG